jgi:predicted ester cyclase
MLERDFEAIPDLQFNIELLPVKGRRVNFTENVFYRFHDERVAEVWSAIDKAGDRSAALTSQALRSRARPP